MGSVGVLLKHCNRSLIPRRIYRLPNNDISQASYQPWLLLYVAKCGTCGQQVMAYQAVDDFGNTAGEIIKISPKKQAYWLERANNEGNSYHRNGATHVLASRREIPFDVVRVPVI